MELTTMRAAFLEEPGRINIRRIKIPRPGPRDVLIKLEYVGICGSDVHYYEVGRIGDFVVTEPLILGHEPAGVIVSKGGQVQGLEVGDRVTLEPGLACGECWYCKSGRYNLCPGMKFMATPPIHGAFAEYLAYPADMVFKLPETVSTRDGALVEPLAIGLYATQQGGVEPGKKVAILGAGCIGLVALLAAKAAGAAETYVADVLDNRLEIAKQIGATQVINAGKADIAATVRELTQYQGADVVIEAAGSAQTIGQTVDCIRPGGAIVLVGHSSQSQIPFDFNKAIVQEVTIKTIFRYRHIFPLAIAAIADRRVNLNPIVSAEFDFDRIAEAFRFVSQHKDQVVKAVVKF